VIDVSQIPHTGKVIFGATVTIINLDTDEEKTYCIVGQDEADIKAGKISIGSPIARALIAKSEGDEVRVTTPGGMIDYEIAEVKHIV
jgi:transcription elongation factor GreA